MSKDDDETERERAERAGRAPTGDEDTYGASTKVVPVTEAELRNMMRNPRVTARETVEPPREAHVEPSPNPRAFEEVDVYDNAATQLLPDRPKAPIFLPQGASPTLPMPADMVARVIRDVERRKPPPPVPGPLAELLRAPPPPAIPTASKPPNISPVVVAEPWVTGRLLIALVIGFGLFIAGLVMFLSLR